MALGRWPWKTSRKKQTKKPNLYWPLDDTLKKKNRKKGNNKRSGPFGALSAKDERTNFTRNERKTDALSRRKLLAFLRSYKVPWQRLERERLTPHCTHTRSYTNIQSKRSSFVSPRFYFPSGIEWFIRCGGGLSERSDAEWRGILSAPINCAALSFPFYHRGTHTHTHTNTHSQWAARVFWLVKKIAVRFSDAQLTFIWRDDRDPDALSSLECPLLFFHSFKSFFVWVSALFFFVSRLFSIELLFFFKF